MATRVLHGIPFFEQICLLIFIKFGQAVLEKEFFKLNTLTHARADDGHHGVTKAHLVTI